jgi:hypothetical protein
MLNWIYHHVINTVFFPFIIVGFLLLAGCVLLIKDIKSENGADKKK